MPKKTIENTGPCPGPARRWGRLACWKKFRTDTKIKELKPRSKPYKVSDGTISGLHVAVSVAGGKTFCLAYRFDGK